ncbi:MAG: helix-turn-helix transcriptional regulator [Thermoleophilaceae bacterium]|nr:helix-turn-helix transcriptional regulator [Thermoleophilaceae bacterium]
MHPFAQMARIPQSMRQSTRSRRRQLFEEGLQVIERDYAAVDLSLRTVARTIATSTRQLQRAFAESGDTSFRRELQRVRMERAAMLLRVGSMPVSHVAAAVGYRQPAQFAKAFRRHHGNAPSAFREQAAQLAA